MGRTVRVISNGEGRGRASSRWRRVGEVSAQVRCVMRELAGGSVGERGVVRARERLQALAPRSRMCGKSRLMSCGGGG